MSRKKTDPDECIALARGMGLGSLEDAEVNHIKATVDLFSGNKTQAAYALEIDRRTLSRRLALLRKQGKL